MRRGTPLAIVFLTGSTMGMCATPPDDDADGNLGGGGGTPGPATLAIPADAKEGDELVVTVKVSSVDGSWDSLETPGAVITVTAGTNLPRDVLLVGGFVQEQKASLGAWDGGAITWVVQGQAQIESMDVSVDPSAAGMPVLALMTEEWSNDAPLLAFLSGDTVEYVMTNEDGGTGLFPPLLLAQWGRPHDIEGLYDLVDHTYQGVEHATLPFDGMMEGSHPRLAMATSNGLVAPEAMDSAARYHVSPMPVAFTSNGVPRERVLDDYPWLVAAGWLEVQREGKLDVSGGPTDGDVGPLSAYVFIDYDITGGVRASFECEVDSAWYSSLNIYASSTGLLDSRVSGVGRTSVELPPGKTAADVTAVRAVAHEGAGSLESARLLSYDAATYEPIEMGETPAPVALDAAGEPAALDY